MSSSGPIIEEEEGCLSIVHGVPRFKVKRRLDVVVKFTDRSGDERLVRATGFASRLVQHEIDHLDGKMIAWFG